MIPLSPEKKNPRADKSQYHVRPPPTSWYKYSIVKKKHQQQQQQQQATTNHPTWYVFTESWRTVNNCCNARLIACGDGLTLYLSWETAPLHLASSSSTATAAVKFRNARHVIHSTVSIGADWPLNAPEVMHNAGWLLPVVCPNVFV